MPIISDSLKRHFIRGYVDGDGCFTCVRRKDYPNKYRYGFELVGKSISILEDIQSYFQANDIKTNIYVRKTNNCFRLMSASKKEVSKIINLLYDDSNVFMERKYDVTRNILQLAA